MLIQKKAWTDWVFNGDNHGNFVKLYSNEQFKILYNCGDTIECEKEFLMNLLPTTLKDKYTARYYENKYVDENDGSYQIRLEYETVKIMNGCEYKVLFEGTITIRDIVNYNFRLFYLSGRLLKLNEWVEFDFYEEILREREELINHFIFYLENKSKYRLNLLFKTKKLVKE